MAGETEQLVVSLEARIRDFERNMQRANRAANENFRGIESRAKRAGKNLEDAMSQSSSRMAQSFDKFGAMAGTKLKGAFAAIAAGMTINELRKKADEYTQIMNSLRVAGVKDGDLKGTFDQLFASAQRNAAPLDALATLYSRVSAAQTTLKASSQEVMQVTDITAQALRVGGTSASEASGALLQLGQALAGGKLQAEEYNSLLDGMRPLLQAAASGMKEAGGDVAQLTALVKDGKVSSEAFFRAILAGAPVLEDQLAGAVTTTEQAMQRLQNEFTKAVGEFDNATGASKALAGAIDGLAGSIGGIGTAAAGAVNGVQALIAKVGELAKAHAGAQRAAALTYQNERAAKVAEAREMGLANSGGRDKLAQERAAADAAAQAAARQAVAGFRASEIDYANRLTTTTLPPARPKGSGSNIKPISLADYAVPGDSKGGAGGGGGGGAEKEGRYERELGSIQRRTEALQREADMVGKGTMEVEKSKIALQLEQAAKRDGIEITDQIRAAIEQAATGYANAKVKVEDLKKAFEGVRDAGKFVGDHLVDSIADVALEGKNATEVVQNLAKALLKAALQAALMGSGPLAGLFGMSGSNGAVGGLFGLLGKAIGLADGGAVSGPGTSRSDSIPAMLSNGEYVVNARATAKNRALLDAMNTGKRLKLADGGFVGAAPLPSLPAASGNRFSSTNTSYFAPTIPITVQPSGNKETDAKMVESLRSELDTLLENKMADFAANEQRSGGMLHPRSRWG